jgi:hypothetical protein
MMTMALIVIGSTLTTQIKGQSDSAYASCVSFIDNGHNVILQMSASCNSDQFSQAVNYYKANGYVEAGYSDISGEKHMILKK